ncbi:glycosyltransferase family 87 protein [Nevskia soli]|uniref:glycosyltransferase family 87 protein n=1 Tax=Nevskia soli TaxID=418856 RepID=UPI0004A6E233|nr:glycosyltransferase family 87 protein [Nevskia soli]
MAPQTRPLIILSGIVLALSAAMSGAYLYFLAHAGNTFNDFFVFWAAARQLQQGTLPDVYNAFGFQTFMQSLTPETLTPHPFVYPPYTALLFWPFAVLPFHTGLLVWNGLSLLLYLLAVRHALRPQTAFAWAVLIAPATMVNLTFGQTGLLTSALTIFGFSLLNRRPAIAGCALGLLAIKPQLAFLPLLVLLTTRNRKAVTIAAITVSLMTAASLAVFGTEAWSAWLLSLDRFSGNLPDSSSHHQNGVTIYFALITLGTNRHVAMAGQVAVLAAVLWAVTRALRKTPNDPAATMAALISPLLATPYALIYDLPVLSVVCLMLIRERPGAGFSNCQLLAMTAAWCLPLVVFVARTQAGIVAPAVMATLFVLVLNTLRTNSKPRLEENPKNI